MSADSLTRDEYLNLQSSFGIETMNVIVALKLSYSDQGRLMAAEHILPTGYKIIRAETGSHDD